MRIQADAVMQTLLSQPLDPLRQWNNTEALRKTKDTWQTGLLPTDVAIRIVTEAGALFATEKNILELEAPLTVRT